MSLAGRQNILDSQVFQTPIVILAVFGFTLTVSDVNLADETTSGERNNQTILKADVIDDDTGEPIVEFLALPGVGRLKDLGYRWQWQPHQIHRFRNGKLQWPPPGRRAYSQDQALRIEAEGYLPFISPTIKQPESTDSPIPSKTQNLPPEHAPPLIVSSDQPATITVRLKRDVGVSGKVVDADGKPLCDATVAIGMGNFRNLHIRNGELYLWPKPKADESLRTRWERPRHTKTDDNGRFTLPSEIQRARVLVVHPYGVRAISYDELSSGDVVELQAWGRIEGQAIWNGEPGAGQKIRLFAKHHLDETIADDDGRFAFDKIPPGEVGIGRDSVPPGKWNGIPTNPNGRVNVPPGELVKCVLGGRGRPIIGKVTGFDNWQDVSVSVHLDLHRPSNSFRSKDDPYPAAFRGYIASAYYSHYDQPQFGIQADGSFRLDDVPAERYAIVVTERDGKAIVRQGENKFRIMMMATGHSNEPLDIGTVEISQNARVRSRKIAPRRVRSTSR